VSFLSYSVLLGINALSRAFYRHDVRWVEPPPEDPWSSLRLVAILNHTSLYEPILAGGVPRGLLRQIARHGVVPVAEKTLRRPMVGRFFQLVAPDVVPVTRQRDQSWTELTSRVRPDSLVIILPEGRMKRATGLDKEGNPMTVRGGIADLLRAIPSGSMLLAYSGGLHHVQHPGELLPRPFKTVRMRLELLDIAAYRDRLVREHGRHGFKLAVIRDLEARRDMHLREMESLDLERAS
jgi:1-acyl-sn-glycerol-3-phosphate acyltransferase